MIFFSLVERAATELSLLVAISGIGLSADGKYGSRTLCQAGAGLFSRHE